ncbi:MAG: PIG-L family deacetylase [Phenylobacterium sp.]|nr:PIG-L family deacetylase [Phenylobacterium sp.]
MATILALHAHPDDLEILAGGTLAHLSALSHRVVIVTATAGEGGSAEHSPEETGRMRRAEAAAAAAHIGASYRCLGLPDLGVFNDDPSRRAVTELLRETRPDVVITASPADYHPDHEAISVLARDACFAAPVANYRTGDAPPLPGIPSLYFTDSSGGRDREGNLLKRDFGVDITRLMPAKLAMISEHRSQVAWVKRQHGVADFLGDAEAWSRQVGGGFGVRYAEGFRQYRHTPYPRQPVLQQMVGPLLINP